MCKRQCFLYVVVLDIPTGFTSTAENANEHILRKTYVTIISFKCRPERVSSNSDSSFAS